MDEKSPEIVIPADKKLRGIILMVLILAAAVGCLIILYFKGLLADMEVLAEHSPDRAVDKISGVLRALALAMGGSILFIAVYLAYFSQRVWKTAQFPPPGTRVIKDTRLITGAAAKRRGAIGLILAAVIGILGIIISVLMWRLVSSLVSGS